MPEILDILMTIGQVVKRFPTSCGSMQPVYHTIYYATPLTLLELTIVSTFEISSLS